MRWAVLPGLALVLVVGACAGTHEAQPPLDGPVMRYPEAPSGGGGLDAEIRGRLVLEGDCLYLTVDELGERYPIVWPAGTTWDAEHTAVVSPTGAQMAVGRDVDGAGGYLGVADVERSLGPEAAALAARCLDNTYGEIAFVNNGDTAIAPTT
ncbi:MAG TPA: hypothetical protein VN257_10790 [Actinotalea sp.]|nr:hypothetical protein [Actinotalea sp.]